MNVSVSSVVSTSPSLSEVIGGRAGGVGGRGAGLCPPVGCGMSGRGKLPLP